MSANEPFRESSSAVTQAANRLLQLYEALRESGFTNLPKKFGCQRQDLAIFEPHYSVSLPDSLLEFLVQTLPEQSLDVGVYKTAPPADLLDEQQNSVPFYPNLENSFFGIGWWTGQGDGDGWMYDLIDGDIFAVGHGNSYDHSRESLRAAAYLKFDGFGSWVRFLEQECRRRGWLN